MPQNGDKPDPAKAAREARLAAALKANIKRRKAGGSDKPPKPD